MPPKKTGGAAGGKKSAKQALKEQREALKAQLANIESSLASTAAKQPRVDSLFDAALGLELWLQANSKAFPADAVKQKVERLKKQKLYW